MTFCCTHAYADDEIKVTGRTATADRTATRRSLPGALQPLPPRSAALSQRRAGSGMGSKRKPQGKQGQAGQGRAHDSPRKGRGPSADDDDAAATAAAAAAASSAAPPRAGWRRACCWVGGLLGITVAAVFALALARRASRGPVPRFSTQEVFSRLGSGDTEQIEPLVQSGVFDSPEVSQPVRPVARTLAPSVDSSVRSSPCCSTEIPSQSPTPNADVCGGVGVRVEWVQARWSEEGALAGGGRRAGASAAP